MIYCIYNETNRAYVSPPNARRGYTIARHMARQFSSVAAALADCCGDEYVVNFQTGARPGVDARAETYVTIESYQDEDFAP